MSCNDSNYTEFLMAIHDYLLAYNVFSLKTTIEGALVNHNTCDFALNFLQSKKGPNEFNNFKLYWNTLLKTDQINCLRLLYNGKTDLLQTRKSLFDTTLQSQKAILEKVIIGEKTSGWVSDYLDEFFRKNTGIEANERKMEKYLKNSENRKHLVKEFQRNFPEIDSLISELCNIVN